MKRFARAGLGTVLLAAVLAGCQDNEPALARGDRLWADSSFTAALAEYRLAATQHGDEHALVRLAHAFARTGALTEAREVYGRLLQDHPRYVDQAIYDYVGLAQRALAQGDEFDAAVAVDAALQLRPELRLPAAVAPVARFYRRRGDADQALAYYQRALSELPADSTPRLLYEMAQLEEERGHCDLAIDYLRAFQTQAGRTEGNWRSLLGEARWHIGSCSFQLAQRAREEGQVSESLERLETMIGLGEPENLLDQAWFERAELLYGLGRFDEALAAYRHVLERNPTRTGQLVERAQQRIDDIRFGVMPGDTYPSAPPDTIR